MSVCTQQITLTLEGCSIDWPCVPVLYRLAFSFMSDEVCIMRHSCAILAGGRKIGGILHSLVRISRAAPRGVST